MMMRFMLATALVVMFAAQAAADIFAPPPYVGLPLSYHAEWEFATGPLPDGGIPADSESDGGAKTTEFLYDKLGGTHIDVDGDGWVWDQADGDGGMTNPDRPASFAIQTINWVDAESFKFVRVQLTYSGAAPTITGAHGYWYNAYHGLTPPTETTDLGFDVAGAPVNVDGNHLYADIYMEPNPDWEQIVVDVPQGTVIDEVVVDSISAPEPATVALALVAGGLFVTAMPRRRREE